MAGTGPFPKSAAPCESSVSSLFTSRCDKDLEASVPRSPQAGTWLFGLGHLRLDRLLGSLESAPRQQGQVVWTSGVACLERLRRSWGGVVMPSGRSTGLTVVLGSFRVLLVYCETGLG